MIETRLLHYFLAVARERNITNAAKALHITQPTLSRQMTLLEEEVGAKLFVRDSRPLALTDEGLLLRRRAEEILELMEKTEAEISSQEEQVEGMVSIGCGELASVKLLMEMIARFSRQYPRVCFDVYTANADQIKLWLYSDAVGQYDYESWFKKSGGWYSVKSTTTKFETAHPNGVIVGTGFWYYPKNKAEKSDNFDITFKSPLSKSAE